MLPARSSYQTGFRAFRKCEAKHQIHKNRYRTPAYVQHSPHRQFHTHSATKQFRTLQHRTRSLRSSLVLTPVSTHSHINILTFYFFKIHFIFLLFRIIYAFQGFRVKFLIQFLSRYSVLTSYPFYPPGFNNNNNNNNKFVDSKNYGL